MSFLNEHELKDKTRDQNSDLNIHYINIKTTIDF